MQPLRDMRKAVRRALGGLLGIAALLPAAASAQEGPIIDVRVNYVYAAQFGFGGYSVGGLSAQVYSLPIAFTIEHLVLDWDLRVGLPVLYGRYDIDGEDRGARVRGSSQSIGFQPSLRLDIPVFRGLRVSPIGSLGIAVPFGSDVELSFGGAPVDDLEIDDDPFYTYEIGLSSLYEHELGSFTVSLGNAFLYAGDAPFGSDRGGGTEAYGTFRTGIDTRRALGFRLGDIVPDASVFFVYSLFTPALEFTRVGDAVLEVPQIFEVGATVGSATPLVLPGVGDLLDGMRVGVGYDRGRDFEAWRVVFGFPF